MNVWRNYRQPPILHLNLLRIYLLVCSTGIGEGTYSCWYIKEVSVLFYHFENAATIYATCFNIIILCILPTECICVFRMVLTINSDCFHKQVKVKVTLRPTYESASPSWRQAPIWNPRPN
jgi:hypothetical protein